jgi:hypothetical protein
MNLFKFHQGYSQIWPKCNKYIEKTININDFLQTNKYFYFNSKYLYYFGTNKVKFNLKKKDRKIKLNILKKNYSKNRIYSN